MVSPILKSSNPTTAHKSPETTSVTLRLPIPSNTYNSFTLFFFKLPSAFTSTIFCPSLIVPLSTLPIAIRPKKEE